MKTKIEKIIKRDDGSRVKISTTLYFDNFRDKIDYSSEVEICGKGKRKWLPGFNCDNMDYRRMDMADRREYVEKSHLNHVSEEELLEEKTKLWESLKP